MSQDANEDAIVGVLKQSLRQLETLGAQRAGLEDMLKEMKRKDDILPKLMASTGSHEDLFRKEISKYDHICKEIANNLEAQEQLLMRIQAQNHEFAAIFNLEDYKGIAWQMQIVKSCPHLVKRVINRSKLQDAITNVKQQCSDFVMTRNSQCREMIEDVQRQIAGLSFQDGKTSTDYTYPSVGPTPRSNSQKHFHPHNHPKTPVYHPPRQPMMPPHIQTPSYGVPQYPPPSINNLQ